MNKLKIVFFQSVITLMAITGCGLETQNYPSEPAISLKEVEYYWQYSYDTEGWVKICNIHFYVIDGDGDLGVVMGDSGVNCYMDRYRFKQGEFVVDSSYNYTIPAPGELGQDKTFKADIYIEVINVAANIDTVFYQFYIVDQAQHKSNTLTTDTLIYGPKPNLTK